MKFLSTIVMGAVLVLGLAAGDAEARRLGGGKSFGMQRQMTPPARSPAAAPAPGKNSAAATQEQPKRSSWMGPLAGLAAGLGLAALASHLGFGEGLASMMLIGLLVMAALFLVSFLMRRRSPAGQPAAAFAGLGGGNVRQNEGFATPAMAGGSAAPAPASGSGGHIPADFDVAAFVRSAKVNFIRLQAANDAANLDDIREFTTPEMFAELKMDISERAGKAQETDVVSIDAEVLDVAEESQRYVVSVRFSGLIREEAAQEPAAIDEIWHLVKPRSGGGWLLAGIEQAH